MKSSYPGCRVGRCDFVVLKPKPRYKRKTKEDYKTKLKYTNREILEIRWCYEYDNWTAREIANASGIHASYIENILSYCTRADIIPKKDDFISFK